MMRQITWLVVCLIADVTMARNPGLTLDITQNGLNYAATVAIDKLSASVQGQTIPDVHGTSHESIGKVDYDVTGMHVTGFSRPSSLVQVNPGHGITWSLSGAGVSVHGDWRYKYKKAFIHIRDHGNFDVSAGGITISVGITMGVDTAGRPTIATSSCSCDVSSVDVHLHGGASWLYNLFSHNIEHMLRDKLREMLCSAITKSINEDAARALTKMKVQVPIEGIFTLDYRLVAPPVFGKDFIESRNKGEFLWTADPQEAPFLPGPLTIPTAKQMVTICMSDYVINTLGYVVHTHGLMTYNLTKKDLAESGGYLNTTCHLGLCIGGLLPVLSKKFPNSSVEMSMRTTVAPNISTTQQTGLQAAFQGLIDFNVRTPDGVLHPAFTTQAVASFTVTVTMKNNTLHYDFSPDKFKFSLDVISSSVGKIPDTLLDLVFNMAAHQFIIPKLNEAGHRGIEIPGVDHVQFMDPQLVTGKGEIYFSVNLKYDPSVRFNIGH